jgi:putative aldouronate transport system permease protein
VKIEHTRHLSFSEKLWMSSIGIIGALLIVLYYPIAKIGVFDFRAMDYFSDKANFMNGIQWFTGWGTPQESMSVTAYFISLLLLLAAFILLLLSLVSYINSNGQKMLSIYWGMGVAALSPTVMILSAIIININESTSELTMFTYFFLAIVIIPLVLMLVFDYFYRSRFVRKLQQEKALWMICAIALAWVIIFAYIPMAGIVTAFFNYKPGMAFSEMPFVGLRFFRDFFMLPDFTRILRNTLVISGLGLTIGFVSPIVFALLLNELFHVRFKRIIQTISYMPYFVSWVVVAGVMFTLLSSDGLINEILLRFNLIDKPVSFLNNRDMFWGVQISANVWKNIGWSSIIYLAAIAGVDQELYQAGAVDGLGRFGRIWHITLPGIRTTVVLLFILGIGGIFNTGFEYQLMVGTELTRDVHEVVDTYVYRYGIQMGRYSFATAVGLMKSVIGFTLVICANWVAKKVSDISIL